MPRSARPRRPVLRTRESPVSDRITACAVCAAAGRPGGLQRVKHVIAVSSCKGGVGKSTTAVNLAYTLLQVPGIGV